MTDTPDWADEIANKLSRIERGESMEKFFFAQASQIAAALRKAKADGLREAAERTDKWFPSLADEFRAAADKLEGESDAQQPAS